MFRQVVLLQPHTARLASFDLTFVGFPKGLMDGGSDLRPLALFIRVEKRWQFVDFNSGLPQLVIVLVEELEELVESFK